VDEELTQKLENENFKFISRKRLIDLKMKKRKMTKLTQEGKIQSPIYIAFLFVHLRQQFTLSII